MRHTIPLTDDLVRLARNRAQRERPNVKNWRFYPGYDLFKITDVNCGRYSSKCTYIKWEHHVKIRSYVEYSDSEITYFAYDESHTIKIPKGYKCGQDKDGFYVSRAKGTIKYHPLAEDLISTTTLRTAYLDHEHTQKSLKKKATIVANLDKIGYMVKLEDSIKAGNCAAGTLNFIMQNDLDKRKCYKPELLLKIRDDYQVRRAIDRAKERTAEEIIRGFCEI